MFFFLRYTVDSVLFLIRNLRILYVSIILFVMLGNIFLDPVRPGDADFPVYRVHFLIASIAAIAPTPDIIPNPGVFVGT